MYNSLHTHTQTGRAFGSAGHASTIEGRTIDVLSASFRRQPRNVPPLPPATHHHHSPATHPIVVKYFKYFQFQSSSTLPSTAAVADVAVDAAHKRPGALHIKYGALISRSARCGEVGVGTGARPGCVFACMSAVCGCACVRSYTLRLKWSNQNTFKSIAI